LAAAARIALSWQRYRYRRYLANRARGLFAARTREILIFTVFTLFAGNHSNPC